MTKLIDKLPLPEKREEIVAACGHLLDSEVQKKTGVGGFAVKACYKVFKAIKPTVVTEAINGLLDDFIDALDPLHATFNDQAGQSSFGTMLKDQKADVAEALVQVTDRKAAKTRHKAIKKLYLKLRPAAIRHVTEAVPGLADLIDSFYAK
jgi:hypothetical protein